MNDNARGALQIHGAVAPGFERVRDAFAANFRRGDAYTDVGAALSVYRAGERVVDLWAGHADRARSRAWQRDTLVNVYSATKGVVAIAAALLVEEGLLDYDAPVIRYWPEFGAAGKQHATVAQLFSHQAGLTGFAAPTAIDDVFDWQRCCTALAAQPPFWPPGEQTSYHAMTWGFLVGEIIRRASGMTIGQLLAERLAGPLGAEVVVGLPLSLEPRVAQMLGPLSQPDLTKLTQPQQALLALVNPQLDPEVPNRRDWRAAEIPAANGHATADGMARAYALVANGGTLDGQRLLSERTIERMLQRQAGKTDLLLGFVDNWAMGLSYNQAGTLGPHADAVGHSGWGGSVGCAHRGTRVAIGYVLNQMGADLVGDPRGVSLCQTVFEAT